MRRWHLALLSLALYVAGYVDGHMHGPPRPAFIAHDCLGAGGDLWATDESDFPTRCALIERNQ